MPTTPRCATCQRRHSTGTLRASTNDGTVDKTWATCEECADEAAAWHYDHGIEVRFRPWDAD